VEICGSAADAVRTDPADLPFCLFYLVEDGNRARLIASAGLVEGGPMAPRTVDLDDQMSVWPLAAARETSGLLDPFTKRTGTSPVLPPWPEPVTTAMVLPVRRAAGKGTLLGFVVAGISPRRCLDDAYRAFLNGIVEHIASRALAVEAFDQERKYLESLERRVEERTRERDRIWNVSPDLLLVANTQGVFAAVNPAWQRLLKWPEEELLGRTAEWLLHPDDRQTARDEVARLVAHNEPIQHFDCRLRHKDGHFLWFTWSAILDEGMIYAVARDITREKAAALALQEVQNQLRQSQKMEAIGQLTGGIAHDFNNLLQGITGSLDLAQRRLGQGRTDGLDRLLTAATTSAERAAALTHRLLAFSRRQPLDPKPVKVNPLLRSMEEMIRRTVGDRIQVEMDLSFDLWRTICDPNQLESAVLNLVLNAKDAMAGGGRLTIQTSNAQLDNVVAASSRGVAVGDYVCVSVVDTGIGMAPEVAERAFEPFFTTKPMGQGNGLGLSMIYGFARQSEGYAKIQSQPGQGASVMLYLPRYQGDEPDDENDPLQPEAASASDDSKVVLVVEDEDIIRDLVVELLSDLGLRAIQCSEATQALDVLRSSRRIDLLMTDIGLPGMNGRQLADLARADRPGLKVLFMTGYAENAMVAGGFLQPGMAMITKPFSMDVLTERLQDILQEDISG
jgi:PAS domain S-box-containing protein